jgi:hypothetical protein
VCVMRPSIVLQCAFTATCGDSPSWTAATKLWNVVGRVAAYGPALAFAHFEQELRGFAFGPIARGGACAVHEATTIVEQHVGRTRQHGFVPVVPLIQPRVGIRNLAKRKSIRVAQG